MAVGKGVQVRPSVAVSNRFIHASRSECAFARSEAQSSGEVGSSVVELTEACFRLRRHARMWRRSVYAASARLAAVTVVRSIARATRRNNNQGSPSRRNIRFLKYPLQLSVRRPPDHRKPL